MGQGPAKAALKIMQEFLRCDAEIPKDLFGCDVEVGKRDADEQRCNQNFQQRRQQAVRHDNGPVSTAALQTALWRFMLSQ